MLTYNAFQKFQPKREGTKNVVQDRAHFKSHSLRDTNYGSLRVVLGTSNLECR